MGKVQFNIKNIHVAPQGEAGEGGVATFTTPFTIPGAVGINLEAKGEMSAFYADGVEYYTSNPNLGYEGEAEVALATDEFRQKILKETLDSKNVLVESADNNDPVKFALGFQIDGDANEQLFWFYGCTATRPTVASKTNEENKEPQTDTIKIKAIPELVVAGQPRTVRTKTTDTTDSSTRTAWFTEVYVPSGTAAAASVKSAPTKK